MTAVALLLGSRPLSGQMINEHLPTPTAEANRYTRESWQEVDVSLRTWKGAWEGRDAKTLSEAYTKDAVVVLGDSTIRGRAAIRAWLERTLPKAGSAVVTVQDFLVSDDVAFVSGQLAYSVELPDGGTERLVGPFAAAFRREWNYGWRVRSWTAHHALPPARSAAAESPSAPAGS